MQCIGPKAWQTHYSENGRRTYESVKRSLYSHLQHSLCLRTRQGFSYIFIYHLWIMDILFRRKYRSRKSSFRWYLQTFIPHRSRAEAFNFGGGRWVPFRCGMWHWKNIVRIRFRNTRTESSTVGLVWIHHIWSSACWGCGQSSRAIIHSRTSKYRAYFRSENWDREKGRPSM